MHCLTLYSYIHFFPFRPDAGRAAAPTRHQEEEGAAATGDTGEYRLLALD